MVIFGEGLDLRIVGEDTRNLYCMRYVANLCVTELDDLMQTDGQ